MHEIDRRECWEDFGVLGGRGEERRWRTQTDSRRFGRSGGKSSIKKVVFERLAPNDTLFIEKTKTTTDDLKYFLSPPSLYVLLTAMRDSSFLAIDTWDLPGGQLDPESWKLNFDQMDAVIFVLDAQSTFHDVIRKLAITMHKAFTANPGIQFEIFLHKIDGMSEDYRLGSSLPHAREYVS